MLSNARDLGFSSMAGDRKRTEMDYVSGVTIQM